mmetsp:Transcript_1808/g.3112  ORF Transcript_1808/g.3112 Transcript_1808/m.3112 type:complete len:582 (-) Transcript_1808:161-1906(-)
MRTFALGLVTLACPGDGRKTHIIQSTHSRDPSDSVDVSNSFSTLASLMLQLSPRVSQHGRGHLLAARRAGIGDGIGRKEAAVQMLDQSPRPMFDIPDGLSAVTRPFLRLFTDLRFAIFQLFFIAFLSALETVIPQGETPPFYDATYPSYGLFFDFLPNEIKTSIADVLDALLPSPGGVAVVLGFTTMFSSPIFWASGVGLTISLVLCSLVTQIPMAQTSRQWNFISNAKRFEKLDASGTLHAVDALAAKAQPKRVAMTLANRGYHVFYGGGEEEERGYAVKGILGRFAPLGVHISMVMIILGATYGALATQKAEVFVDPGRSVVVKDVLNPVGALPGKFAAQDKVLRVDDFRISYKPDGKIDQYYSDLALETPGASKGTTKTIKVNEPLVSGGLTVYQSDWKLGRLRLKQRIVDPMADAPGEWKSIELPLGPMGLIKGQGDKNLFATSVRLPPLDGVDAGKPRNVIFAARDLISGVLVFGPNGQLVTTLQPNAKVVVEGTEFFLEDVIGASGLTLKVDPGVKWVYAGFAGTMAMTLASFLAHSQVWLARKNNELRVGGTTNRLKDAIDEELKEILAEVETA